VNRLRRKIDAGRATPLLQTRRGAGYILGGPAGASGGEVGKVERGRSATSKTPPSSGKDHA
jgi:hypothetical protein